MKYDNRIKIRFWRWNGMNYPFDDLVITAFNWHIWREIEYCLTEWIGNLRYLIQFPWFVFVFLLLFPLIPCGIMINNARILWRYFKRIVYRSLKGLK